MTSPTWRRPGDPTTTGATSHQHEGDQQATRPADAISDSATAGRQVVVR